MLSTRRCRPSEYPVTKALRKLGWIEGKNLVIERHFADLKVERLAGFAQEMIRKRVELIVTGGADAAIAAARATNTIPIVFFDVRYPVEHGLVESFARPGRNVTGTASFAAVEMTAKRFEFLREAAPTAKRVYVISPSYVHETVAGGRQVVISAPTIAAARSLGFEVRQHIIRDAEDIEAVLAGALSWGAQAMVTTSDNPIIVAARQRMAEFALRHRLPSVSAYVHSVEAGGLLSYGPSVAAWTAMFERGMEYVDRILRGARPADLPVEQPSNYELAINLKTANALGLKIPQSLLVRADRVIH